MSELSTSAHEHAIAALDRVIYLLDRSLAAPQKIRAFAAAKQVISQLEDSELVQRCSEATLETLVGIGSSTGSVISAAVLGSPNTYIERLESTTEVPLGEGADLRALLRGDCHLHSHWSDGSSSIESMAISAMALGHSYIVMTDHSPRLTVAHGLTPERFAKQAAEIASVNERLAPFRVLRGCEVDILEDGSLDLPEELLAGLDLVVASVHSKLAMPEHEMTARMVSAIASPHVDVLGHCTGRKVTGTGRKPSSFDADLVFAACKQFGVAVEINCRPERQDPPDDLVELAKSWGTDFVINTDAHAPGQLEWLNYGCDKATNIDISSDRIINTKSAEELVEWTHFTAA